VRSGPQPEEILAGLDPEQRAVATALGGPVVVIAGAGTGKTRAITHRIAYGVASGAYNPTAVLAVTFTQRAAGELRGRLASLGVGGVQARTFHSAALRQAQYFWPRVYGGELPMVLDNRMGLVAEAAGRLRVRTDTARLRDLVSEIAWAKVSNVTAEDYQQLAAVSGRSVASFDPETIARVFAGYEQLKRDRGRIDFEDILLCAAAVIADNPEVADAVRRTYRHLVVDEYQDVSPLQEALLNLWRGDRPDICVVGDPAQTIHSFAGARATFLTEFPRRHPAATVIRLVRDYRSTPEVVAVANGVMEAARDESGLTAVKLQAQLPPGPRVEFAEAADEPAEAAAVADWIARQAEGGIPYREMAVLFRINAQSPAVEQALADRGIPYLVRGGERFYERPEVRQALMALRTHSRALTGSDGQGAVEQVKAVLTTLGWTPQPPDGAGAVRERWESLAALVSVAEDLVASRPAAERAAVDLAVVSAELERRAEVQHVPSAQGVTVATLHSAKGLEWDAVCLLAIHEGSLPFVLATTPAQVAEERRLLYVGVTRARQHLRISWSRTRSGGGATRKVSRFLAHLAPGGTGAPAARRTGAKRSVLSAHCRACGHTLGDAAERKLGRHTGCPASYDEATVSRLKEWRASTAGAQSLPAYCVFTDATLIAIAEARPKTAADLLRIHGLGQTKAAKYGPDVLAIVGSSEAAAAGAATSEEDRFQKEIAPAVESA
jgi:DNA helicase-2/ATP-dependent DNA helicase PcrA